MRPGDDPRLTALRIHTKPKDNGAESRDEKCFHGSSIPIFRIASRELGTNLYCQGSQRVLLLSTSSSSLSFHSINVSIPLPRINRKWISSHSFYPPPFSLSLPIPGMSRTLKKNGRQGVFKGEQNQKKVEAGHQ